PRWAGPLFGRVMRWKFRRGFVAQVKLTAAQLIEQADFLFRFAPVQEVTLHAEGEETPDEEMAALAALPCLKRLRGRDLGYSGVAAPGLIALARSPHLSNLTRLELAQNHIGLPALRALVGSPHLASLARLKIWSDSIDSLAIRELASSCKLPALTALD